MHALCACLAWSLPAPAASSVRVRACVPCHAVPCRAVPCRAVPCPALRPCVRASLRASMPACARA
eukprot:6952649-Alexandrium_andersonii.AAC.1